MTAADPTYVRNPAIAVTEIDDETFLVEPAEGEVFYLDEISSALLHELGMPLPDVLADLIRKPRGIAAGPFSRFVTGHALFFAEDLPALRVLERELTQCTEPGVAFHNAMLRLRGLIRKRDGLPAGYTAS